MSDIDWNDLDGPEPDDPWEEPCAPSSADSSDTGPTSKATDPSTSGRSRPPAPDADGGLTFGTSPPTDPGTTSLRARVLAHPDLARRLCDPPLRYSRPECWTGYVPSEQWQGRHNDSTRRLQLVGIVAELEGREKAAVETSTTDEGEPS